MSKSRCGTKVLGCDSGSLDMCLIKSNDFVEVVTWVRTVGGKTLPVNTPGFSVKMVVISRHNSKSETVLELDPSNYISIDSTGVITISIPKSVIEAFSWIKGNYSINVTNLANETETILIGKINVRSIGSICC